MLRLLALETRLLFREKIGWLVLLVMAASCAVAVIHGRAIMNEQAEGRAAFAAAGADADRTLFKAIADATPATASTLPRRVSLPVVAPIPVLADFSAGRSGYENYSTIARLGVREEGLFKRTRLDNPEILARGQIDLGFVAIVVLPLLLIALGYGVFAGDRDSGVARLAATQSPSMLRLLIARSVPRLALAAAPIGVAAAFLLLAGPQIDGRAEAASLWLLVILLLALLWWSAILLVNSFRITAESAALLLVSGWVVVTLVLPALLTAAAQAANPPPSRFEQIAVSRAAEIRATADFENDHPELTDATAERRRLAERSVQIDRDVEAALAPINAAFEERRTRQRAVAGSLSFLSPTMVAAEASAAVAGTDGATWLDFRRAAGSYLRTVKEALRRIAASEAPLSAATYTHLPRFAWGPSQELPLLPIVYLLLLTLLMTFISARRLHRPLLD